MHRTHLDHGFFLRSLRTACIALVASLSLFSAPDDADASLNQFFLTQQVRSDDISAFTKWTDMLNHHAAEQRSAQKDCDGQPCEPEPMEALIKDLKGQPLKKQIQAVNSFFNAFPYVTDQDNWGVEDYWETPAELIARGGDCEDYAIAKYMTLKRLGVAEANMRIMIVKDSNLGGEMHALLEVKVKGVSYILDNQAAQVLAEHKIYHYRPIYAINEVSWWAYE